MMKKLSSFFLLYLLIFSYPSAEAKGQDSIQKAPFLASGPPKPALERSEGAETAPSLEESRAKAEEARLQAESVMASYEKSIKDLEMELRRAEEESIKTMAEKEALVARKTVGLELAVASQLEEATRERGQLLRDRLQVLRESLRSEEEVLKARNGKVTILEKGTRLADKMVATPLERVSMVQKEVEVEEAYLQAANAELRGKESYLAGLKVKFKEAQVKIKEEERRLRGDLKTLEELPFGKGEGPQRFVYQSRLLLQTRLANINGEMAIGEEEIKLAERGLEKARIDSFNAQLKVSLLKEEVSLLEGRLKAEELQKKEEEAKIARRAEEERKKEAEVEKAAAHREEKEALRKAEELTRQQRDAVSPERRRLLEMESTIFTLQGEIAKKKDTLATERTRLFEDNAEYKKLVRDVHTILGGENTPSEIREEMPLLKDGTARWEEKLEAVESLLEAVHKERSLLAEQIQQARSELVAPPGESPEIIREAEILKDTALASKLMAHAQEKVKLLEEEGRLVTAWVARIEERRGIIREGLRLLADATTGLSSISAANMWVRQEWKASWSATKGGLVRLLSPRKGSDIVTFIEAPAQRNIRTSMAGVGVLALVTAAVFGWYYCKRWCRLNLKRLEEAASQNYIKAALLPALFRVLQGGVTLWLVLGLCFGIASLFEIEGPLMHSLKYGLIVFSIYKVLHGFLVEAVRPKGWGSPPLTLPPPLAWHGYLTLHTILLYSAIFITIIGVLGSFGPRTQEILWRVYSLSVLALFIWFVAPKSVFLALLSSPSAGGANSALSPSAEVISASGGPDVKKVAPPPGTKLRKFQRGCIHTVHPLTIAFLVLLVVLDGLGYTSITYALIGTAISCVITLVAVAVARKLITTFILDRLARKRPVGEGEGVVAFKVTRGIVDYSSVIVSIIVIVSLWVATLVDSASTPAAPGLLKGFTSKVGHVLDITVGVLGYKLGLGAGGEYTTPFKIIIGLILVGIAFLVAATIKRLFQRRILGKLGFERGMETTISSIITYVIIAFSVLFAMSVAGVPLRSLAFFAGALGIGIGFGLQNIIHNFVSGIILLFERPVRVGDIIILGPELGGTVEKIGPRSTTIVTPDNIAVVVPNSKLIDTPIVNWSQPTSMMRVHINVGVAYGSNLELVKNCLLEVAKKHPLVRQYPEPMVRFEKFGDSALVFELIYWVDNAYARWVTLSELNFAIDKTFREHNISIPFPQQDLHIRTVLPPTSGGPQETKGAKDTKGL